MQIRIDLESCVIEAIGLPGAFSTPIGQIQGRKPGDVIVKGYIDLDKVPESGAGLTEAAPADDSPYKV